MQNTAPLPKISLNALNKHFEVGRTRLTALSEITLNVERGEFICIVGPSGCGKTTLLRIMAGLEEATSGTIVINRNAEQRHSLPATNMVFQEQSLFPWKTVRDNVAFGLKARGVDKKERLEIADTFIAKVGLAGFGDAYPHQLSGGMRQRVSIARAFANDPDVLLMDEPFAALDEQTKLTLQDELLRIWEEMRKTVVFITHSIDEAIILADRIVVMGARPGRILEEIDVSKVFPRPRRAETTKTSPAFGELFHHIWMSLGPNARKGAEKRP